LEAGIRAGAKRWPILNDEEMYGTVYEIMNARFQETGEILKYETVCDSIEEELKNKAKKYMAYVEPDNVVDSKSKVAGKKSLNNNLAGKKPASPVTQIQDSTERAIAIFQRELRKGN
jgi:hypothetical protein